MRGRTVLAVAHRLSTLAAFDRIIVLRDGRIVEDGSPSALRRQGGTFDGLWHLQAEGVPSNDDGGHLADRIAARKYSPKGVMLFVLQFCPMANIFRDHRAESGSGFTRDRPRMPSGA
jgi:ABC-type multidrug transport system ATPase subunit